MRRSVALVARLAGGLSAVVILPVVTVFWASAGPASAEAFAGSVIHGAALTRAADSLPRWLSQTGLYLEDGSIDPRNQSFVPVYPLWTDGAAKSRWIRLPAGSRVDVTDVDAWRFPPGTIVWKEFSWHGRKVETRMIRIGSDNHATFAAYVWNPEQTDAELAPADGAPRVFEIRPGKRHSIPSVADCAACHTSGPTPLLGFNALQLSDARDPLAPHAESLGASSVTLRVLVEQDRLQPARPEFVAQPPRIRARDPVGRAAMGYLSSNCGICHNARGPLTRLGFSLQHNAAGADHEPEPAVATALGAATRFALPTDSAATSQLLVPGAPAASALLHRMSSRRAAIQMPPLGSVLVDSVAVDLVRRWITGLRPLVTR